MAIVVNMPRLSDTMEEGTRGAWQEWGVNEIEMEEVVVKSSLLLAGFRFRSSPSNLDHKDPYSQVRGC